MKCPKCQTENPESSLFCASCGAKLDAARELSLFKTETLQTSLKELSTGSTFANRYQIIEELGKGGMGKVYKAFDQEVQAKMALKLIKPEVSADKNTIDRFRNELKIARDISHKNICRMYDLGREGVDYFITMEYVSGEDLKSFIRRSRQLVVGTAIFIAKQVCEGLVEAHRVGVVHRDLKPGNIMIDKEGNAKIMDFGIARSISVKGITGAGVMIGTPEYMSPEQVEGKEVDQRSDIYSMGIILYEMLTGQVPFEGDTPFTIGVKQKSETPRDPKELNAQIPQDLSRLILKCLEKDKERRYQSAGELGADLEKIEKGVPTTERPIPKRKTVTSREITVKFNLKKLALPLSIAIVLIAAGIILWKFVPHKKVPSASAPKIENSIAVISFKNQTGDPSYDYLQEAIPNLLITNLENSGLFYVATWERMQDVLRQMGVKPARAIDSDLGFELCRREGIKAIAIGSFTKAGDVFRTDVKVLDVESKRLLKGANTRGTGVESVLASQIDALSRDMSFGLGIDKSKVESTPFKVADITTTSLQAYEYFLKGKEAYSLVDWEPAKKNLRMALEIDPGFAMAYVYLAWAHHNTGDYRARDDTIEKAMALADRTSQRDRLFLEAGHALFIEQDYDRHIALLQELVQKYPDEKWAFHYLGDFYLQNRYDAAGAREQYEKWLALDPRASSAISHLIIACALMRDFKKTGELIKLHDAVALPDAYFLIVQSMTYFLMGQFDQALAKSRESLEMQSDFNLSLMNLTMVHAMREEYEESLRWADEYVAKAVTAGAKSDAHGLRGFVRFLRGSYADALKDFDMADKMAEEAGNWVTQANALEGKGLVNLAKGEFDLSRTALYKEYKILVERVRTWIPFHKAYLAWRLGLVAIKQGQTATAGSRLSDMRAILPEIEGWGKGLITELADLLEGEALLIQGDLDGALAAGQKAGGSISLIWFLGTGWHFLGASSPYKDLTARVLAQKGNVAQAISEYERLLRRSDPEGTHFLVPPLYHYRLGLLYERAGDIIKAQAQFKKFLDLWKDADPGQPEMEDAKARLAALEGREPKQR
jgi:serine/threonine protein kinase/tetratricopeptide (TPR) repeat protein